MKQILNTVQGLAAALVAWLSARLGLLGPVLIILVIMMALDYLSGMAASKYEALEHPDDPAYGWSSARGAKGILKKFGYILVIGVAMVVDYIILYVTAEAGIAMPVKAFFGLLVTVWYILNELLSIIENAGRMDAQVPEWLMKYIAVLKNRIDSQGEGE